MKILKLVLVIFVSFLLNSISLAKDPSELINGIVNEASLVLKSSDPVESKIIKLNDIAERSVDISGIGMYPLGKHKKTMSEDQKTKTEPRVFITTSHIENKTVINNKFTDEAVSTFLSEYYATKKLKLPNEYAFRDQKTNKLIEPFLMQLYITQKLKQEPSFGNFSGTGAGKTLSAILASRVLKSRMTLVVCPNDVVRHWEKFILEIFPNSTVISRKNAFSAIYDESKFQYLVINYGLKRLFFQYINFYDIFLVLPYLAIVLY